MLCRNQVLDGVYRIEGEIGRGGASIAYLAYHQRLQKYVVLKNARINSSDMAFLRNEVDMLKELHHAYLPQVYDFLQLDGEIYTVIDFIDGSDFEKLIAAGNRFSEERLAEYLLELAEVLVYLHNQNPPIIHSDIKPGNIMLRQDNTVCLIDFNISMWSGNSQQLHGFSRYYTSPEQIQLAMAMVQQESVNAVLDGRSDIYSLGASMYYIMTGIRPYEDGTCAPLSALHTGYSRDFIRIIETCMEQDPAARYQTAEELLWAVKKYLHRGSTFRQKCIAQAAIVLGCGLMICAGIWSLFFGLREQRHELFLDDVAVVRYYAESGDYRQVVSSGIRLLNEYEDQSSRSRKSWLQVLKAVGESYGVLAENAGTESDQAWENAADYYGAAAAFAARNHMDETTDCVILWASAAMACSDDSILQQTEAFEADLSTRQSQLLRGIRQADQGQETLLLQLVQQSGESPEAVEAVSSACLALAAVRYNDGDVDGQLEYLAEAYQLKQTDEAARQLAEAFLQAGEQTGKTECFAQACSLYQSLVEKGRTDFRIRLHYATALRAGGRLSEAQTMIDDLCQDYPRSFDVMAQAALIYSQSGEKDLAAQYAQTALTLAPEQSGSEIYSILQQLAEGQG